MKEKKLKRFNPFAIFSNPHLQTFLGHLIPSAREDYPCQVEEIPLGDGDRLAVVLTTPAQWSAGDRTVVMVHGLTGSDQSPYMVRLAGKFHLEGYQVVRVNLRGCGRGEGLAQNPYNAGQSSDISRVLDYLLTKDQIAGPITLAGFSLGGNIVLKLLGEWGHELEAPVDSGIAVCPPADLKAAINLLSEPQNRFYEWYFLKFLLEEAQRRQKSFENLPPLEFPSDLRLYDFDDLYTAPRSGYQGAEDYYHQASSHPLLSQIGVPTLVIASKDDPFVDWRPLRDHRGHTRLEIQITPGGGHMGFLGPARPGHGLRWLDGEILAWIQRQERKKIYLP